MTETASGGPFARYAIRMLNIQRSYRLSSYSLMIQMNMDQKKSFKTLLKTSSKPTSITVHGDISGY